MRLPFPERIPFTPVCIFAVVLCTLQLYQGTAPLFSLCSFLFILLVSAAFNVAGGLTRPSGAYIFFFSVLAVVVGLFWKAVIGEPADSNLIVPITTIEVYLGTGCGMLGAAYLSRRLTSKRALLASFVTDANMQSATVGCMIAGLGIAIAGSLASRGSGTIVSALAQVNHFLPLAMFLGVIHTIRRSGGTRSISTAVLICGSYMFLQGLVGFTKEGLITPFVAWLVAAASQRYRVTLAQIAGGILVTFIIFQYLVPYSQYGRTLKKDTFTENLDVSLSLLTNLGQVRQDFKSFEKQADEEESYGYFTHHQGFFDRLQMIGPDDALNNLTEQGVVPGITPVFIEFAHLVPNFIWPNKPWWGAGNLYAHQMGYLAEDDFTTGISFSPAGESFHFMRWTGVFVLAPVLYTMLFVVFDSLCGDTRDSPWGLIAVLSFAHIAPEGGLGTLIYALGYLTVGIVFAAFTASYIMPRIGEIFAPKRESGPVFDPFVRQGQRRRVDPSVSAAG